MDILDLLKEAHEKDAADLILKVGSAPLVRVYGDLTSLDLPKLKPDDTRKFVEQLLAKEELQQFRQKLELDLCYTLPGLCRFRVNIFQQRGSLGIVCRRISNKVPTIDELGLPELASDLAMKPNGMVLVTGPTGSGKSTTQAAMVDYRNEHEECHIVTIEDPVEYIHPDKKALVNQRQVGRDTRSFSKALKHVLRQDPDVILIGDMRDLETISMAITAAETGHLVLGTLHTVDSVQTVDRIIDVFPTHQQGQVRMQLSQNLIGIFSQILLERADGNGQVASFEVLLPNDAVRNLIRENKTYQLPQFLETGKEREMISMNRSLASLVRSNVVTFEEALKKSSNPDELKQLLGKAA